MLIVEDIFEDAKRVLGTKDEKFLFRRISDAIEALANTGQWDPLTGYADLCVDDSLVTLPREIEQILAVNIDGHPSIGRDTLFSFHLNGPGDNWGSTCRYEWMDRGDWPTYRDIKCPGRLVAFVDKPEDASSELWVYGYDQENREIRTKNAAGDYVDGYQVPTIFGYAVPDVNAPIFSRVTRIRKGATVGQVRLSTFDNATNFGTLLGVYEHDELDPIYRRIRVSSVCSWVRITYRKRTAVVTSLRDRIPLHNRYSVVLMLRALKAYDEGDLQRALGYEANAVRFLQNEEYSRSSPNTEHPMQVDNRSWNKWDDGLE